MGIASADVWSGATINVTNASGWYNLTGFGTGDFIVTANKSGYVPRTSSTAVVDGVGTRLDFTLYTAPACAPGGVIQSCGCNLTSPGTYTLASDLTCLTSHGVIMPPSGNGSTLDCQGKRITGNKTQTNYPVYVQINTANMIVKNCEIYDGYTLIGMGSTQGITKNLKVENNYLYNATTTIGLRGCDGCIIANNTLNITQFGQGISLYGGSIISSPAIVADNLLVKVNFWAIDISQPETIVRNNTVTGCTSTSSAAVRLGANNIIFEGNNVSYNADVGVTASSGTNLTVYNNKLHNNVNYDLKVYMSNSNISRNYIAGYNSLLSGADNSIIEYNSPGSIGVQQAKNSTVRHNNASYIYMSSSDGPHTVYNNTIQGYISLNRVNKSLFENNSLACTASNCVNIGGSSSGPAYAYMNTFRNNSITKVSGSNLNGFYLNWAANSTIENNTIANTANGIQFYNSNNNTVRENVISGSTNTGIWFNTNSNKNFASSNTIGTSTNWDTLCAADSVDNTRTGNACNTENRACSSCVTGCTVAVCNNV